MEMVLGAKYKFKSSVLNSTHLQKVLESIGVALDVQISILAGLHNGSAFFLKKITYLQHQVHKLSHQKQAQDQIQLVWQQHGELQGYMVSL
jgi:hypothetical protein